MHEQVCSLHEHLGIEAPDLLDGVGVIAGVVIELTYIRFTGHTHVKVVEPHRVRHRRVAREGAVTQAVLPLLYPVHEDVERRTQVGDSRVVRLDHRRAHRAGVVEGLGEDPPASVKVPEKFAGYVSKVAFGQLALMCAAMRATPLRRSFTYAL